MLANWRVNALIGLSAFLFTYFFSILNNIWQISLFRAIIGFILFFLLGYIVRFILDQGVSEVKLSQNIEKTSELNLNYDLEKKDLADSSSFQSISLDGLHSGDSADELNRNANIIRTWTSQNQEG